MSFCEVVKPTCFSLWQVKSLITLFWNIRMPLKRSAMNEQLDHRPPNSQDTNTQSDQKIHHQHPTSAPSACLASVWQWPKKPSVWGILPGRIAKRDFHQKTFGKQLPTLDQFLMLRQAKPKTGSIAFHHIGCLKKRILTMVYYKSLYTWVLCHPQQIP